MCIYNIDNCFVYECRAITQAVSRGFLTAEAHVRPLVSPCVTCGEQNGLGQVYLRVLRFSPVITTYQCYTLIFIYVLL